MLDLYATKMPRSAVVFVVIVACISVAGCIEDAKSPILYIPGLSGSRLNVVDSSSGPCDTNGESRNVWINGTLFALAPQCFTTQLRLNYSANYTDAEGITVTAIDFDRIVELQPYPLDFFRYFEDRGYTANVDIRIGCYDWRLAPEQLLARGYYSNLKQLIQTMYETNGNRKVTIVAHSLGGPVSLYFLTRVVNQEWKDTYIHSYIALAGVWSGANGDVVDLVSGPNANDTFERLIGVEELRDLYRTFPSLYLLLPRAAVWNDTVLVVTPSRNYTANDYQQLFADAGYPQGYTQFTEIDMLKLAPNVPTYCYYGLGVDTPMTFIYDDGFPNTPPTVISGDGDSIVNRPSSEICLQWANSGYPFKKTVLQGIDHSAIPTDASVLQAIEDIVTINGALPLPTVKAMYYVLTMIFVAVSSYNII